VALCLYPRWRNGGSRKARAALPGCAERSRRWVGGSAHLTRACLLAIHNAHNARAVYARCACWIYIARFWHKGRYSLNARLRHCGACRTIPLVPINVDGGTRAPALFCSPRRSRTPVRAFSHFAASPGAGRCCGRRRWHVRDPHGTASDAPHITIPRTFAAALG